MHVCEAERLASNLGDVHVQSLQDGTVSAQHMQAVCSSTPVHSVRLACVNEQNGESCLTWACGGGHWDIAKYLCELGGEKLLMLQSKVRMCAIVVGATCMYVHRDMQGLVGALGAYMRNQRSICVSVCSSTLVGSSQSSFPSHTDSSMYTGSSLSRSVQTVARPSSSSHCIHVS